jgi:signal recognition particle subunit SRP54
MFNFLSQKISAVFTRLTGQDKLTEKNIDETLGKVHDSLIEADVPYETAQQFIDQVKQEVLGQKVFASLKPTELLMKIVHDKIVHFLGGQALENHFVFQTPAVVMMIGLQGSGKTTTIAKLVNYVQEQAQKRGKTRRIMVASVDFYRPAAVEQLEILAKQVGARFYRSPLTDPIQAAQDSVKHFQQESCDLLFLDTAGRLHVDEKMLEELQAIEHKIKPKYKLLVVDAMIGQESLKVAQVFETKIGLTGAILSKMDSEARGGVAFAFRYMLHKPILFVGTGEKPQDLELFRPERMASRIIGMGDIKSLIEKAQEKIKESEQESMYESLSQGKLTLQDFAKQIDMVNQLGSLSSLLKYLPGANSLQISPDMVQKGEVEIKKFKAIINSMTLKERLNAKLIDNSRKSRIARGAGVTVSDINTLLDRFEQSQKFVQVFKKMNKSKFFK